MGSQSRPKGLLIMPIQPTGVRITDARSLSGIARLSAPPAGGE